ncbi:hypothetical protein CPT_Seuss97 [Caulobacter phage Seuss]|uniref:Uncharacterized protein n=1 Tax=Caulobacter phage Seuss TaxID=1675601 RepID=A0A0K1LN30_9CAUD|nr:hypothetical protein HOR08_gp097 [Caulobacter phage Seuss]AKU43623.1 hypothetical protein CPT_Seuss97 [Caulobacter phage Seuss]
MTTQTIDYEARQSISGTTGTFPFRDTAIYIDGVRYEPTTSSTTTFRGGGFENYPVKKSEPKNRHERRKEAKLCRSRKRGT